MCYERRAATCWVRIRRDEPWTRKTRDWRQQEMELVSGAAGIETPLWPGVCYGEGTFELGNRAHSLCLARNHAERGQLVKSVPSDCVRLVGVQSAISENVEE